MHETDELRTFPPSYASVAMIKLASVQVNYKWCERFLPTNLCNRSHHL